MKKYITLAALLAAGSACANAGTATVSTPDKTNQGSYYGFTLAVGNGTYLEGTDIFSSTETTNVNLDSVSILTRDNNTFGDAKLAVFTYVGDSNVGTLVGLSDAVTFTTNTDVEFSFTGTTISVSDRYQYLFVSADTTAGDLTDLASYQAKAMQWGVAVTNGFSADIPQGWGTYKSNGINSWEGQYIPVVDITVSASTIPEPSAFGVLAGLGALALVASRRRRK